MILNLVTNKSKPSQPKSISSINYNESNSAVPSQSFSPEKEQIVSHQLNKPLTKVYKPTPKKLSKTTFRNLEESIPKNPNSLPIGSEPYGEGLKSGQSNLTVENGTDADAIIRLIRSDGCLIRNFYIKANSTFTAQELPPSSCIMKVAFGVDWNPSTCKFNYRKSFSKSEQFEITETHWTENTTDGYIEHTRASQMSITLHKVPHGNFHTYPIDEKEFWK